MIRVMTILKMSPDSKIAPKPDIGHVVLSYSGDYKICDQSLLGAHYRHKKYSQSDNMKIAYYHLVAQVAIRCFPITILIKLLYLLIQTTIKIFLLTYMLTNDNIWACFGNQKLGINTPR